jgi:hypothetical protein
MIFDEAYQKVLNKCYGVNSKLYKDIKSHTEALLRWISSKETEETLKNKYFEKIHPRMEEGRDFNDICDDEDIFLSSKDSSYVYQRYVCNMNLPTIDEWRETAFLRELEESFEKRLMKI